MRSDICLTADEIRQNYMWRDKNKTFVVVEGITDIEFWDGLCSRKCCRLWPACGKSEITDALSFYELLNAPGLAGIVDADYWLVRQVDELNTENLLYDSRYTDLEMILLKSSDSSALTNLFLNTFTDYGPKQVREWTLSILNIAQRLGAEFGYFRWLNDCNQDYRINFEAFEYEHQPGFINFAETDFIDIDTLELRREWTARRLAESSSEQIDYENLLYKTAALRKKRPPNGKEGILLCRGKDVISIITFVLPRLYRSHFGTELPSSAKKIAKETTLAKELRKAYRAIYFKDTTLRSRIRSWEKTNCPYKILKPDI